MILIAALLLDAVLGEPRWLWSRLPHPAVLMGRAVARLDKLLNHPPLQLNKGALALALLVLGAGGLGWALAALPTALPEIVIAAILLAHRSLVDHVADVSRALRLSDHDARLAVARIVGRDTDGMDRPAIARAAIESAAENFSDGVIAPAFWFLIGGLPGLLIYKAVNTADSMIGYRTPRHDHFGKTAARLDDLLNWIPARLTALLIKLTAPRLSWVAIAVDARLHRSPNAGWPEAAMARALGIALAGPRSYHGETRYYSTVNPKGRRDIGPADIDAALAVLWRAWAALLLILALGTLLL